MRDRRSVDDLSIEELEQILRIKKREARLARLERQGLLRRPAKGSAKGLLASRPPRRRGGRKASDVLVEERREGR